MTVPPRKPDHTAGRAKRLAAGLFPHQVEGLAFLLARRRAILADDMGLGKTRQSVLAMRETEPEGPYLVVCPASVKLNWEREIHLALGAQPEIVIIGGATPPPEPGFRGWVVINYDILKKHVERLGTFEWSGFIFDEAHYLKNYKSQRSKVSRDLVEQGDGDPVVHCLTGTPLTNRPRDLFPLLQLVDHALGKSFLTFAKRYCAAYRNNYGWVTDGASHLDELTIHLHGTMLRRRKEDVLDLPPKLRTWLPVKVPASTGRRDVRLLLKALMARGDDSSEGPSRFELIGKLAPARKQIAIAKVKNTIEFVQGIVEQGEKVVVYTCFTIPAERIAKHFGDAARMLTGKTPANRRQRIVDEFQDNDEVRVLVANIIAGGVGVNLTAARTVVFNDLDWVPANHWQAEDRAYRIGQEHAVNVYYFTAAGTIDEFVAKILESKSLLIASVVEGESILGDGAVEGDVFSELERVVRQIARAPDEDGEGLGPVGGEDATAHLLRVATETLKRETPEAAENVERAGGTARAATRAALQALTQALTGPVVTRYRIASYSGEKHYTLEVDGSDVTCSCPAFEHRGQCRHTLPLKEAVAKELEVPDEYELL